MSPAPHLEPGQALTTHTSKQSQEVMAHSVTLSPSSPLPTINLPLLFLLQPFTFRSRVATVLFHMFSGTCGNPILEQTCL